MDFDIRLKSSDMVFVHPYDDQVWLALHINGGSARVILTREEAQKIIEAMQKIVEGVPA